MSDEHVLARDYRPDIDGLRGIAVIIVLLFHAGFDQLTGGFIGVDIFFVISGYLITKILYSNCKDGKFNYFEFISKRFFRLYPSLLVALFLSFVAGFFLLSPEHFSTLGKSTVASLFSVSNIVFLNNSGYFSQSSLTNALLHTWSLGVEQQFYFFWPFVILLAFKLGKKYVPIAIAIVGGVSLYLSQREIQQDPSAAYFLTQFRVFEFAIGSLVPWLERFRPTKNAVREALLALGLIGIAYSALAFTSDTSFPGTNALLPCLAAALCIWVGKAQYLGLLIRNRLIVGIGLISYSLYIVHWPIIVFYKYYVYAATTSAEKIWLVVIPFLIAYPMYRFVENKFRRLTLPTLNAATATTFAGMAGAIVAMAFYAAYSNGATWRLGDAARAKVVDSQSFHQHNYGGEGFQGQSLLGDSSQKTVSAILIGDSFAGHLTRGLDHLLKQNSLKAISIWESGCLMGLTYTTVVNGAPDQACERSSDTAMQLITKHDVPILIAESWAGAYFKQSGDRQGQTLKFSTRKEYAKFIKEVIFEIRAHVGETRQIIVFGSPPGDGSYNGVDLKSCLERPNYIPSPCSKYLTFPETRGIGYVDNLNLARELEGITAITFLNPYALFCHDSQCSAMLDNEIVYSDAAHLSIMGSVKEIMFFESQLLPVFARSTGSLALESTHQ